MKILKTSGFTMMVALLIIASSCANKNSDKKEAAKGYMKSQTVHYQEEANAEAPSEHVSIITDKDFKKTIKEGVTLVDFWATWCKPCLMQAPIVEQLAAEMKDQAVIAKMDVDQNPRTPQEFNIANIPTIMIFKDGKMVERFVGIQSKEKLQSAIQKHLDS